MIFITIEKQWMISTVKVHHYHQHHSCITIAMILLMKNERFFGAFLKWEFCLAYHVQCIWNEVVKYNDNAHRQNVYFQNSFVSYTMATKW